MTRVERRKSNRRALATEHLMHNLARRTAQGGAIAIFAQILRMSVQLANMALLARLLAPEDFGLVAMAATITLFASLFTDLGLSTATIQQKRIDQNTVSVLFYINLAAGLLVMVIACATAPVAAWFFKDDKVTWIVIAMATSIPFTAAGAQHRALLARQMRWISLHWTSLAAITSGSLVAVGLAWQTELGYWALVANLWVTALVETVLLWVVMAWRPSRVRRWSAARRALKFGMNLTGFNLANYLHRQADNVLIGWYWGSAALGFYTRAYTLFYLPMSLLAGPVGSAVVPALSRLQDDRPKWLALFTACFSLACFAGGLFGFVMFIYSEILVTLIFGQGWDVSVDLLPLLAISVVVGFPASVCGWALVSLGKSGKLLVWAVCAAPVFFIGFLSGLPFGPQGVAVAYSLVMFATAPVYIFFICRNSYARFTDLILIMVPCVAASTGLILHSAYFLENPGKEINPAIVSSLVAQSAVYLAVTGLAVYLLPVFKPTRTLIASGYNSLKNRVVPSETGTL